MPHPANASEALRAQSGPPSPSWQGALRVEAVDGRPSTDPPGLKTRNAVLSHLHPTGA
jgi:hypothetical protein